MNSILIGIILAGLGAGGSWYYKQEAINAKIFYDSQIAAIEKKSETERKLSEERNNDIEAKRLIDKKAAEERIKQLAKRQKPVVTSCSADDRGIVSAAISDGAVRLLRDTANDPRLSAPDDPTGFIDPKETVTADSIAAYSFYDIEQYNQCAADFNALGLMVK